MQNYSQYEQLVGGVQTLFGAGGKSVQEYAESVGKTVSDAQGEYDKLISSQNMVMDYAADAYKNAGMSANQYMDTVTSFSAALKQSLGGDTVEAAKYGNMAVTDMSDKMLVRLKRIELYQRCECKKIAGNGYMRYAC